MFYLQATWSCYIENPNPTSPTKNLLSNEFPVVTWNNLENQLYFYIWGINNFKLTSIKLFILFPRLK